MARPSSIRDLPLATIDDTLKIPTGGFGDVAVTVGMLKEYFKIPSAIYFTSSPNLKIEHGYLQQLELTKDGHLNCNLEIGQYMFVLIVGNGKNLTYQGFDVVNQFNRHPDVQSYVLLVNLDGRIMLYGCEDAAIPV